MGSGCAQPEQATGDPPPRWRGQRGLVHRDLGGPIPSCRNSLEGCWTWPFWMGISLPLPSTGGTGDESWLLLVPVAQTAAQHIHPVLRGITRECSFWGFPHPPGWLQCSRWQQQWEPGGGVIGKNGPPVLNPCSVLPQEELKAEPLLLRVEKSQMRWLWHLIMMPSRRLPSEVFRVRRPQGRLGGPMEGPGHIGETMSPGWPENASGSPQKSWMK